MYVFYFFVFRLGNNCGQFSFGIQHWQQFCLQYCTEGIKFSIALPPDQAVAAEEGEVYPDLIACLQYTLNMTCALCLPSARKPVCHLKCPLDHPGDSGKCPHLPLDEISGENEVLCSIMNTEIPKEFYFWLIGLDGE